MSHIYLREYQRNLIPFFKKYQLTELAGDKERVNIDQAIGRLSSTAQNLLDGDDDGLEVERTHVLNLKENIREVDFFENAADLAILYEVTGYQGDRHEDKDFWINYESYKSSLWNSQMSINRRDSHTLTFDSMNTRRARAPTIDQ